MTTEKLILRQTRTTVQYMCTWVNCLQTPYATIKSIQTTDYINIVTLVFRTFYFSSKSKVAHLGENILQLNKVKRNLHILLTLTKLGKRKY